jgi:hypothetical protein
VPAAGAAAAISAGLKSNDASSSWAGSQARHWCLVCCDPAWTLKFMQSASGLCSEIPGIGMLHALLPPLRSARLTGDVYLCSICFAPECRDAVTSDVPTCAAQASALQGAWRKLTAANKGAEGSLYQALAFLLPLGLPLLVYRSVRPAPAV